MSGISSTGSPSESQSAENTAREEFRELTKRRRQKTQLWISAAERGEFGDNRKYGKALDELATALGVDRKVAVVVVQSVVKILNLGGLL